MNRMMNAPFVADGVLPARVINVAVDTAYLYSQPQGQYAGTGVYMMDNNVAGGSQGEGGEELTTQLTAGFGVAFNAFSISTLGTNDTVSIEGFEISSGTNIFGVWGYPQQQTPGSSYQWLGTAFQQGNCTYQIKIGVSIGGAPTKYYWWDPFLNCTA
jgi:hypothetical protein